MEHKPMDLENVGNGVLRELFKREAERVADNLFDPNTDAVRPKPRKIVMVVTFLPVEGSRRDFKVEVTCDSKLAPVVKHTSIGSLGFVDGKPRVFTNDVRQESLNLTTPGVTPIAEKQATA